MSRYKTPDQMQKDTLDRLERLTAQTPPAPEPGGVPPACADAPGKQICPWCGDPLWVLKPSGGCLFAEKNGFLWHPQCADLREQAVWLPARADAQEPGGVLPESLCRYTGKDIGIHGPAEEVQFRLASEVADLVAGLRQELEETKRDHRIAAGVVGKQAAKYQELELRHEGLVAGLEALIAQWRAEEVAAGQYSVESREPDFEQDAATHAEILKSHIDQIAALLSSRSARGTSEGT